MGDEAADDVDLRPTRSRMSNNFHWKYSGLIRAAVFSFCVLGTGAAWTQTKPGEAAPAQAAKADPQRAEQAYLDGARMLDRKDLAGAQVEFARAATLDPTHPEYGLALTLTREHRVTELIQEAARQRLTNHGAQAETLLAEARTIDPDNELVLEHLNAEQSAKSDAPLTPQTQVKQAPEVRFAPPIELQPTAGLQDLHLRGETKDVVTKAATAYGIKVVFDDSVTNQTVRFDLEQTPYKEAMPILLHMTHLFAVPVDTKTLLVAKDTEENRGKFERQVEETIYIPASTTEQMNELSNIIKNVFDVKQIVVSNGSGTIAVRAPAPTLEAVNYTLADMLDGGAEVMLEIKLVTVDKSITRNLGVSPPTSGSAFSAAAEVQSFVAANESTIATAISSGALTPTGSAANQLVEEAAFLILSGLATDAKLTNVISFFGHGLTLFGASIGGGATANFGLSSSEARALDDINVRIGDRQTTTLRIGEKYPITTATYSSGISSATASALAGVNVNGVPASTLLNQLAGASTATVPQVQYEDLGITLKTTPTVLRSNLIALHIDMKIEALTGASLNNIPVLTNSVFTSDITVQEGKTVIMLSDMSSTESASVSGLPGLGELPGFSQTLSETMKTTDSSELIMLITPHVVRRRKNMLASRAIPFHTSVPAEF
jgi:general secretion pathway protein D